MWGWTGLAPTDEEEIKGSGGSWACKQSPRGITAVDKKPQAGRQGWSGARGTPAQDYSRDHSEVTACISGTGFWREWEVR